MGTSSSKPNAGELPSGDRRNRSKGSRVFQSYCLGSSSESRDSEDDEQVSGRQTKENGSEGPCASQTKPVSVQLNAEYYRKVKVEQPNEMTRASSNVELGEWGPSSLSDTVSRAGSTSSRRSSNPSSRFLSRFSFFPGNISFRLSRATSLGSSRAYPVPSTSSIVSNDDELHLQTGPATGVVNRNEIPPDLSSGSSLGLNPSTSSVFLGNLRDDHITSAQDEAGYIDNTRDEFNIGFCSPRNHIETDDIETRLADRRLGVREPVEPNVQFSRTLSVGRLRDRVLRRPSFPDIISSPLQQESEVVDAGQGNGRPVSGGALVSPISSGYSQSIMPSSLSNGQDYDVETSRAREVRYHDLLEHRSNFLERRRRIRSQVRALQRMGSRFGNLSVHERSCILSGQHRNGRCTCRANARDANSNDNNGARASISRLVMLAEALFEVLDEIHQQTVALSSRPSMSSIGSVPAPNEVVESLPVKLYSKLEQNLIDEDAQCYICLVEYEEGDSIRVLPCHHEFHRPCIDKWLKEIHRICPLCRGDICRSDSLPAEN